MDVKEKNYTVYQILLLIIRKVLKTALHLGWVFVRMTIYWIVKLIYWIFKLTEIDVARQRAKFNKQDALTTIKHEFVFDKSEEFITEWMYFKDLVFSLDLENEEKEELFDYVLRLIAESEREAFNTTYNYMITKDLKEPSFEDMVIQGIFKTNTNIEPRAKIDNPYYKSNVSQLRSKRNQKKYNDWSEKDARGIY